MGEREIPIEIIGNISDDGDNNENVDELAHTLTSLANTGKPPVHRSSSRNRNSGISEDAEDNRSNRASLIITHEDGTTEENPALVKSLGLSQEDIPKNSKLIIEEYLSPGESSDEEGDEENVSTVQVEIHRQTSEGSKEPEPEPVTVEEIKIIREKDVQPDVVRVGEDVEVVQPDVIAEEEDVEILEPDLEISGSSTQTVNLGQKEGVIDETWSLQSRKVSIERGAGSPGSPPTVAKNPRKVEYGIREPEDENPPIYEILDLSPRHGQPESTTIQINIGEQRPAMQNSEDNSDEAVDPHEDSDHKTTTANSKVSDVTNQDGVERKGSISRLVSVETQTVSDSSSSNAESSIQHDRGNPFVETTTTVTSTSNSIPGGSSSSSQTITTSSSNSQSSEGTVFNRETKSTTHTTSHQIIKNPFSPGYLEDSSDFEEIRSLSSQDEDICSLVNGDRTSTPKPVETSSLLETPISRLSELSSPQRGETVSPQSRMWTPDIPELQRLDSSFDSMPDKVTAETSRQEENRSRVKVTTIPIQLETCEKSGGNHVESPVQQKKVGESPVRQRTVGESPVQQRKVEESPVQQKKVGESPVQQRTVGESPVQQRRTGESPVQQEKVGESPVQHRKVGESPVQQRRAGESAVQEKNVGESTGAIPKHTKAESMSRNSKISVSEASHQEQRNTATLSREAQGSSAANQPECLPVRIIPIQLHNGRLLENVNSAQQTAAEVQKSKVQRDGSNESSVRERQSSQDRKSSRVEEEEKVIRVETSRHYSGDRKISISRESKERETGSVGGKLDQEERKESVAIPIRLESGELVKPNFGHLQDLSPPTWSIFHQKGSETERVVPIRVDPSVGTKPSPTPSRHRQESGASSSDGRQSRGGSSQPPTFDEKIRKDSSSARFSEKFEEHKQQKIVQSQEERSQSTTGWIGQSGSDPFSKQMEDSLAKLEDPKVYEKFENQEKGTEKETVSSSVSRSSPFSDRLVESDVYPNITKSSKSEFVTSRAEFVSESKEMKAPVGAKETILGFGESKSKPPSGVKNIPIRKASEVQEKDATLPSSWTPRKKSTTSLIDRAHSVDTPDQIRSHRAFSSEEKETVRSQRFNSTETTAKKEALESLKKVEAELEAARNKLTSQVNELAGQIPKRSMPSVQRPNSDHDERLMQRSKSVEADKVSRTRRSSETSRPSYRRERSLQDIDKDIETIWRELQELDKLPIGPTQENDTGARSGDRPPSAPPSLSQQVLVTPSWRLRNRDSSEPAYTRKRISDTNPPRTTEVPSKYPATPPVQPAGGGGGGSLSRSWDSKPNYFPTTTSHFSFLPKPETKPGFITPTYVSASPRMTRAETRTVPIIQTNTANKDTTVRNVPIKHTDGSIPRKETSNSLPINRPSSDTGPVNLPTGRSNTSNNNNKPFTSSSSTSSYQSRESKQTYTGAKGLKSCLKDESRPFSSQESYKQSVFFHSGKENVNQKPDDLDDYDWIDIKGNKMDMNGENGSSKQNFKHMSTSTSESLLNSESGTGRGSRESLTVKINRSGSAEPDCTNCSSKLNSSLETREEPTSPCDACTQTDKHKKSNCRVM